MKTHLLLKIVPALILCGMVSPVQSASFVQDSQGNIFEASAPTSSQNGAPNNAPRSRPAHGGTTGNTMPQHTLQQLVESIINQGRGNSARIAQLTAEAAAANPKSAAVIIASVEQSTGISGETLATAVGRQFQNNPELAAQAPAIASALVSAILDKGPAAQHQEEIAETVAILVTSLPGNTQSNQQIIARVGHEVSSVLSVGYPEIATEVVGITSSVLKTSSGSSDVSSVISSFADAFKTNDASLNTKLDNIVTNVNAGQVYNALPTATNMINTTGGITGGVTSGLSSGVLTTPETSNQNG